MAHERESAEDDADMKEEYGIAARITLTFVLKICAVGHFNERNKKMPRFQATTDRHGAGYEEYLLTWGRCPREWLRKVSEQVVQVWSNLENSTREHDGFIMYKIWVAFHTSWGYDIPIWTKNNRVQKQTHDITTLRETCKTHILNELLRIDTYAEPRIARLMQVCSRLAIQVCKYTRINENQMQVEASGPCCVTALAKTISDETTRMATSGFPNEYWEASAIEGWETKIAARIWATLLIKAQASTPATTDGVPDTPNSMWMALQACHSIYTQHTG